MRLTNLFLVIELLTWSRRPAQIQTATMVLASSPSHNQAVQPNVDGVIAKIAYLNLVSTRK